MEFTQQDVEDNLGLVYTIAERMKHLLKGTFVQWDDIIGAGTLGLIWALERFDPDRGKKFSDLAGRAIKGSILNNNRSLQMDDHRALRNKADRINVSLRTKGKDGKLLLEDEISYLGDQGSWAQDVIGAVERDSFWDRVRECLDERECQVLNFLLQGFSYQEISRRSGIPANTIRHNRTKIITKAQRLRHRLGGAVVGHKDTMPGFLCSR